MNGLDFLTLACTLARNPSEAASRSAVSRAYYAAFHVARQLLEDLRFRVPAADRAHGYLWLRLANCGDPHVAAAGMELKSLRSVRNRADYELGQLFAQGYTLKQIQLSEKIISTLDAAQAEPLRTRITDGMKVYERDVLQDVTWHL